MNSKPNFLLYRDLSSLFDASIQELKSIESEINNDCKQRVLKGLFLYSYSVFESTLTKLYFSVLNAFPDRINLDNLNLKQHRNVLFSSSLTHNIIESIVYDYSKKLGYGNIRDSLKKLCKILLIDYGRINISPEIEYIKKHRNSLSHSNILNDRMDIATFSRYLRILINTLQNLKEEVKNRYISYTKTKLVRDSWNYLFNSPLLVFECHWKLNKSGKITSYNSKILQKYSNNLSHSERTLFIFFMQNYNTSLCSTVYSTNDISMHISFSNRDKIAFIMELFDRYPLLLQEDIE